MADAGGSITLRLGIAGADQVKAVLATLGPAGAKALREIEAAQRQPTAGMRALSAVAKDVGAKFGEVAAGAGTAGRALSAFGPLGVAAAVATGTLVSALAAARAGLAFADEIGDSATRIGIGTKALQEWRYTIHQAGGEAQNADEAIAGFTRAFGAAKSGLSAKAMKPFAALGLDPKTLGDVQSALAVVTDRIAKLSDKAEQAAVADKLGLTPLLPALRNGAAWIDKTREAAERLGYVMDDAVIQKAGEANDKIEALATVTRVQLYTALADLGPVLVHVAGGFADAARLFAQLTSAFRDSWPVISYTMKLLEQMAGAHATGATPGTRAASALAGMTGSLGAPYKFILDRYGKQIGEAGEADANWVKNHTGGLGRGIGAYVSRAKADPLIRSTQAFAKGAPISDADWAAWVAQGGGEPTTANGQLKPPGGKGGGGHHGGGAAPEDRSPEALLQAEQQELQARQAILRNTLEQATTVEAQGPIRAQLLAIQMEAVDAEKAQADDRITHEKNFNAAQVATLSKGLDQLTVEQLQELAAGEETVAGRQALALAINARTAVEKKALLTAEDEQARREAAARDAQRILSENAARSEADDQIDQINAGMVRTMVERAALERQILDRDHEQAMQRWEAEEEAAKQRSDSDAEYQAQVMRAREEIAYSARKAQLAIESQSPLASYRRDLGPFTSAGDNEYYQKGLASDFQSFSSALTQATFGLESFPHAFETFFQSIGQQIVQREIDRYIMEPLAKTVEGWVDQLLPTDGIKKGAALLDPAFGHLTIAAEETAAALTRLAAQASAGGGGGGGIGGALGSLGSLFGGGGGSVTSSYSGGFDDFGGGGGGWGVDGVDMIGANAKGTDDWRGGLTRINERGGEIMDLPRGTRIIPHDVSMAMAKSAAPPAPPKVEIHNHSSTPVTGKATLGQDGTMRVNLYDSLGKGMVKAAGADGTLLRALKGSPGPTRRG